MMEHLYPERTVKNHERERGDFTGSLCLLIVTSPLRNLMRNKGRERLLSPLFEIELNNVFAACISAYFHLDDSVTCSVNVLKELGRKFAGDKMFECLPMIFLLPHFFF